MDEEILNYMEISWRKLFDQSHTSPMIFVIKLQIFVTPITTSSLLVSLRNSLFVTSCRREVEAIFCVSLMKFMRRECVHDIRQRLQKG